MRSPHFFKPKKTNIMNQDFKFYINYLNKDKDFFEETKFFKSYDRCHGISLSFPITLLFVIATIIDIVILYSDRPTNMRM